MNFSSSPPSFGQGFPNQRDTGIVDDTSTTKEDRFSRLSRTATFAVIAVVLLVSLVIVKPAAPDKITLLTGPAGSGYHELGKRYALYLEDLGLEVDIEVTDGGFDNVGRRRRHGGVCPFEYRTPARRLG